MADAMATTEKKGFLTGRPMKRVLKMGAGGALFAVISDAAVEAYIEDDASADATLGTETKRGAAQIIGGLILGGVVEKYDKDFAVGIAAGGVVAGGVRIAKDQGWDDTVAGWFDSEPATTTTNSASGYRRRA